MKTRDCDCPHSLPFCVHELGYTGESLAYHSRVASSVIGWPTRDYDPDALAEHNTRMAAAKAEREAREAAGVQVLRTAKPRVPLGVKLGSAECGPCQEAK